MKHVLISCDACGKTVPDKSVRGWWGLVNPKSDLPTFSFAPLTPKTIDKFSGHVCGAECLQKTLTVLAGSVEMEKVTVAEKKTYGPAEMDKMMRAMMGFPPMFGSAEPKESDDDEEY